MDEPIVMGSTIVPGKESLCKAFLEKVPNKFYGGWIDMKWLKTNFKNLLKDAQRNQIRCQLPTPVAVMDLVVTTIPTSPSERPKYVPIDDKVELWAELCETTQAD
ncbi:hypothetical protein GOBAR_AA09403 [Gossypium barbadense]|uniref:Uncharacterized protein n=1 Tax=Gossypium barbadense TaxID=3634 RepID=A0A2P5Y6Q7_GOSBA|nr:hypothetical protein GOBAR_AA09403 [Gossypium barbadense]